MITLVVEDCWNNGKIFSPASETSVTVNELKGNDFPRQSSQKERSPSGDTELKRYISWPWDNQVIKE